MRLLYITVLYPLTRQNFSDPTECAAPRFLLYILYGGYFQNTQYRRTNYHQKLKSNLQNCTENSTCILLTYVFQGKVVPHSLRTSYADKVKIVLIVTLRKVWT